MRLRLNVNLDGYTKFQLTHLLRGATLLEILTPIKIIFQLTHLLRGATNRVKDGGQLIKFQLTHLLRGATQIFNAVRININISTHAPLARCDVLEGPVLLAPHHFNSRTSCEVRPKSVIKINCFNLFQLTHLLRGATYLPLLRQKYH